MKSRFRHLFWSLRIRLMAARLKITEVINRPISSIKAFREWHQLEAKYPNRWERYCEQKRRENRAKRLADLATAQTKLIGAISRMNIAFIVHCDFLERGDQNQPDHLQTDFIDAKRDAIEAIDKLEKLEAKVSPELKTLLATTTVDCCHNLDEYQTFSDKINALIPRNIFDGSPA